MTTYGFVKVPPINTTQLTDEITTAGIIAPTSIDSEDVNLSITFSQDLTPPQQDTLSSLVAAHVPTPGYVSLATQQAIATLTGYLNNPNPTISNTARAAVVATLAPNLPPNILATINARIAAALGV